MIKFKNKNTLYFKLCLYFSSLIIAICILIIGVIYFGFYHKFNNILEDTIIAINETNNEVEQIKDDWIVGVRAHSIVLIEAIHGDEVAQNVHEKAKNQKDSSKTYTEKIDGKELMYNINISKENGELVYTYSIIRNIYKEVFPTIILMILLFAIFIIIVAVLIVSAICKHLVKDINEISEHTNRIAYKDWNEPINISANSEELVNLAGSIDHMRCKLKERDNQEQSMLEYISHELKTPIMIIGGYTEAIKDDIYPSGDLNSTLDIILEQTNRMQSKVQDLLFITKLNNNIGIEAIEAINLYDTLNTTLNKLLIAKKLGPSLDVKLYVYKDINILGDLDKINVLFENMIDNQFRYAKNNLIIRAINKQDHVDILFFNDGEKMSILNEADIFKPFKKGNKGKSGLGLSICKKIAKLHKGDITFIKSNYGCLFKVCLKKDF